jgi:hypothetical protein
MSALQIRPYRAHDREGVRDVCFRTGFQGEPIDFLYADFESWADMYTSYYTDAEPESAWVVITSDERVVGYLLGCVDTSRWWSEIGIAFKHQLTRFLWARPSTAKFWWRAGFDMVTEFSRGKPEVDLARYPAHMHCNLMPEARTRGVGAELIRLWHEALSARGVTGVHGETQATNAPVHGLLAKFGYRKHGEPYSVPGLRGRNGERLYGQLVLCDLSSPGPSKTERGNERA